MKRENINYNFRTQPVEKLKEYLESGRALATDINSKGLSPLFFASLRDQDARQVCEMLMQYGADPHVVDLNGRNVFFGCRHDLIYYFAGLGVNVNQIDYKGQNSLFYCDSPAKFQNLINCGADYTLLNNKKENLLEHHKNKKIIKTILSLKKDINEKDDKGKTPLFYIRNIKKLLELSLDYSVLDDEGNSPLFGANASKTQTLLDKGLDVNHLNKYNENAAFYCKGLNIFNLLLNKGLNVNQQNTEGETCIFKIYKGNIPFSHIINSGVDLSIKNNDGDTFFDTLYYECEELLLENRTSVPLYNLNLLEFNISYVNEKTMSIDNIKGLSELLEKRKFKELNDSFIKIIKTLKEKIIINEIMNDNEIKPAKKIRM